MISSKLNAGSRAGSFYRYYAGYSVEFAEWAITQLGFDEHSVALDPWNGSGTTLVAASRLGIRSIGYEINPVMVDVARARLKGTPAFARLSRLIDKTNLPSGSIGSFADLAELYSQTIAAIGTKATTADELLVRIAFFGLARDFARQFASTKNPTWFSSGRLADYEAETLELTSEQLRASLKSLIQRHALYAADYSSKAEVRQTDFGRAHPAPIFDLVVNGAVFSEIASVRHFFAHRAQNTNEKVRNWATNIGFSPYYDPETVLVSGRPSSGVRIVDGWLADTENFFFNAL